MFQKYGIWAIVIDAFTPIPYKFLTWGSGIMKYNIFTFALVSFPVRTLRYILVANTASFIGDQMRQDFEKGFLLLVVIIVGFLGAIYYLKNKIKINGAEVNN